MGSKLKNKKFIIMIGIVILVISTGIGVYLYKENHNSIVMDIIENYENELGKNSLIDDKEYSEEDLQNLKTDLEEFLKDIESKKSTMEILWGDYSKYDKLVANIKNEVKAIDEQIVMVKKVAEQKAKEEAEKKAEEERLAKAEEERKAQEEATKNNQQSSNNNENYGGNSSGNSSGSSNNGGNGSNESSKPSGGSWHDGYEYRWRIRDDGVKVEFYLDRATGNTYDLNGNYTGNMGSW